jgi:hypothetical protein
MKEMQGSKAIWMTASQTARGAEHTVEYGGWALWLPGYHQDDTMAAQCFVECHHAPGLHRQESIHKLTIHLDSLLLSDTPPQNSSNHLWFTTSSSIYSIAYPTSYPSVHPANHLSLF